MSEYQYYEWQTIDRPLNASEQREVDGLSSHMDTVTSTQAVVTYSWGDFKHDPEKILLQYFDAFLYDSNFGVRRLMFRLPKDLVDVSSIQPYLFEDRIMLEEHGKYFVLEIQFNEDADFFEWSNRTAFSVNSRPCASNSCRAIHACYISPGSKLFRWMIPKKWEKNPNHPCQQD